MSRRVVIVIVEGSSDRDALSDSLNALADPNHVHFQVMQGDFTSSYGTSRQNIKAELGKRIAVEMNRYRFSDKDIMQIVHLMDTDGAFIPESRITYSSGKRQYDLSGIKDPDVARAIKDNRFKAENMNKLASMPEIKKIPYRCFYFSRNLEHVLHGIIGEISAERKEDLAEVFATRFENKPDAFRAFFEKSDFRVKGCYNETWAYIREGTHSLERHSNFHLIFELLATRSA